MTFMMTGDNGDIAKTLQPLHIYPLFRIDDMHETRTYRLVQRSESTFDIGKNSRCRFPSDFLVLQFEN